MSKRFFLALVLLIVVATASSASAQSSFIIDNRTGSDILVANGSNGDVAIGQRNPGAQLDILSNNPQIAFRVEANSGDQWLINQNGGLQSTQGPRIVYDSNVANDAYSDTADTFITSGDDGSTPYDIVLNPSADGRVNVSNNLNMMDNNITNFFEPRCGQDLVVDGINENGSYQCINVSQEIRVYNLSETLEAGNVANQSIDMNDNLLNNVGRIRFENNAEIEDPSIGTLQVEAYGAGDNDLFRVKDTSADELVFKLGEEEEGSFLRNPANGEDIIRFNQSGGSDVEIPNGNLMLNSAGNFVEYTVDDSDRNLWQVLESGSGYKWQLRYGNEDLYFQSGSGSDNPALQLEQSGTIRVPNGNLSIGANPAQSGTLRLENNEWITARNNAGDGDVNMFRIGTDDEIRTGVNLDLQQNNINEVNQIIGNNNLLLRPETDSNSIRLQSTDGTDLLRARGISDTNAGEIEIPAGNLDLKDNNVTSIGNLEFGGNLAQITGTDLTGASSDDGMSLRHYGSQHIIIDSDDNDGNGRYFDVRTNGLNVTDSTQLFRINSNGEVTITRNNLDLNSNNITNINEIQDYYDSEQCGEFRAVKGIYPNGTYICTAEILEEETEGLNESLDAGNFAGNNDIYMNQSQILEIGTGETNFTNDGGLDLGGDVDMNQLRLYNSIDNKEINFGGGRISVYGGLDIRDDARLTDDQELEFGTDLNYDFRMDSASGDLILRNGSNQIMRFTGSEDVFIENGKLDLTENNLDDIGAIRDGSDTNSLVFDESNNLRIPNGYLDLDNNQINDTSKLKNDGRLELESDSQNSGSGDLVLQTGGSDRLQVLNDGQVKIPNSNLNISQNLLEDVNRINFQNGDSTAYISEYSGDALGINSEGGILRLQDSSSYEISAESDANFNENNIRNVQAIQDNSGTDSIVFYENNSLYVPNGNLNMNQNNINQFFDSNCANGEVVEQVYANGSYSCIDIDAANQISQDLSEVLDVGNEAGDDDINMTEQDITDLDQLRFYDNIEIGNINTLATGSESLAIGKGAVTSGPRSVSLGDNSNATGQDVTVVGFGATNNGNDQATAIGDSSQVTFTGGTAVGRESTASGTATALGQNAQATGIGSFANGAGSSASARNAIAIGRNSQSSSEDAFALGVGATSDAEGAIAIGAGMTSSQTNLTRIGLGEVEIPNGNLDVAANNITNIDQVSGNSGEAIESQDDINMTDKDINEARAVNFGNGQNGKRLVKVGGDLCLGDECAG